MKYIKIYEDFDISNLSQYWNIVRPRNWESNLTNGTWEDDEMSELVDLGFKKIGSNLMEFYSSMNIFIISIAKYYDITTPDYKEIYKMYIISSTLQNGVPKEVKYTWMNFHKLLEHVENLISEEEKNAKKYNL